MRSQRSIAMGQLEEEPGGGMKGIGCVVMGGEI